jgi:hypothetical protein
MAKKWRVAKDGIHIELVDTETEEVLERPKTRYGSAAIVKRAAAAANRALRENRS